MPAKNLLQVSCLEMFVWQATCTKRLLKWLGVHLNLQVSQLLMSAAPCNRTPLLYFDSEFVHQNVLGCDNDSKIIKRHEGLVLSALLCCSAAILIVPMLWCRFGFKFLTSSVIAFVVSVLKLL